MITVKQITMINAVTDLLAELSIELPDKAEQFDQAMFGIIQAFECRNPECECCDRETFEEFHVGCEKKRRATRADREQLTPKGRG